MGIFPPVLVMIRIPFASAEQVALTWKAGGATVGVAVGDWQNAEPVATSVPVASRTSMVSVPYRPVVLILKDWPGEIRKEFCATGVPFRLRRQVKGVDIFPPVLVMIRIPFASAEQVALTWKDGGATVGVAVGDRQNAEPVAITVLVVSRTSMVSVPYRPLVLILKDWPGEIKKEFCATGVPFRLRRQVKGVDIFPPVLVMIRTPCASGEQAALTWKAGGARVGVAVGDRQNVEPVATTVLVVSRTSRVRVPYKPLVLIVEVWPAVS